MSSLSLSPSLRARVEEYAEAHRHPVNRAIHYIGIPLLATAGLGLLSKLSMPAGAGVPAFEPNAAWFAILFAAVWYLRLDRVAGLMTLLVLVGCYVVGCALPTEILLGFFAAGVLSHLVGHYVFEGKPPTILSNPLAILEAPAWMVAELLGPTREIRG